jgi:mycothiol synthase
MPLSWRLLDETELPAVAGLARACLGADGGQPFAAREEFVRGYYLSGGGTYAAFDDGTLVCVSSLRPPDPGRHGDGVAAVTTGLVHPAWRRRGLGGRAFDWAAAAHPALAAETEALGDGAHALYLCKGLSQVFAEDVMTLDADLRPARAPGGVAVSSWGQAGPARFFAVYAAAFGERPGFPGWPRERWIEWISDDEDFRADWTLLATLGGADAGFVAAAAGGWITQMGVVPAARGMNIGAWLITEAVRRMRAAGETAITLNVNVNNPHAAALYRRLGFTRAGRRGRYRPR